jgi:hypothetical protein
VVKDHGEYSQIQKDEARDKFFAGSRTNLYFRIQNLLLKQLRKVLGILAKQKNKKLTTPARISFDFFM